MGWGLGHVCRNQGRPQASLELAMSLWTSRSLSKTFLLAQRGPNGCCGPPLRAHSMLFLGLRCEAQRPRL